MLRQQLCGLFRQRDTDMDDVKADLSVGRTRYSSTEDKITISSFCSVFTSCLRRCGQWRGAGACEDELPHKLVI